MPSTLTVSPGPVGVLRKNSVVPELAVSEQQAQTPILDSYGRTVGFCLRALSLLIYFGCQRLFGNDSTLHANVPEFGFFLQFCAKKKKPTSSPFL